MKWNDVRQHYPHQWLIIEALEARTIDKQRILDRVAVVETCPDGTIAIRRYQELHKQYPQRELYFVHTQRQELDIVERRWVGIRSL